MFYIKFTSLMIINNLNIQIILDLSKLRKYNSGTVFYLSKQGYFQYTEKYNNFKFKSNQVNFI